MFRQGIFLTRPNPLADRLLALEDGPSPGRVVGLGAVTTVVAFLLVTWNVPARWNVRGTAFWLMLAVMIGAPVVAALRAAFYVEHRAASQMFDLLLLTDAPAGLVVSGLARVCFYRARWLIVVPAGLIPVFTILPWLDALLSPGTYGAHGEVVLDGLATALVALGLLGMNGLGIAFGIEHALYWRGRPYVALFSAPLFALWGFVTVMVLAVVFTSPAC
ncbi:MAG: hypothetical protein JXN59_00745, partial [Anaerolineae bacterium]|nr:hypothetical protein [Anaerolineae bacterium]